MAAEVSRTETEPLQAKKECRSGVAREDAGMQAQRCGSHVAMQGDSDCKKIWRIWKDIRAGPGSSGVELENRTIDYGI